MLPQIENGEGPGEPPVKSPPTSSPRRSPSARTTCPIPSASTRGWTTRSSCGRWRASARRARRPARPCGRSATPASSPGAAASSASARRWPISGDRCRRESRKQKGGRRMSRFADYEREFFASQLDSFLPDRVFDAHTHLWRKEFVEWSVPGGPDDVGYPEHCELMQGPAPRPPHRGPVPALGSPRRRRQLPAAERVGRPSRRRCFGLPRHVLRQTGDDPEWVRQEVKRLGLHGLKCYHTMAAVKRPGEAEIPDYLPETAGEGRREEGWAITLHMVKSRAAARPGQHPLDPALLRDLPRHAADPRPLGARVPTGAQPRGPAAAGRPRQPLLRYQRQPASPLATRRSSASSGTTS